MKWNVSVLRRSGECERTEVADFELAAFLNRIASAEGKAWVLSVERVGDVGDSALVEPDGDELVSQLGKRRWRVMGDPEDGWWVEVDSNGNELPGDWEYDRKGGYVYCAFAESGCPSSFCGAAAAERRLSRKRSPAKAALRVARFGKCTDKLHCCGLFPHFHLAPERL